MHHYRSCEGVNTGFSGMGSPVLKVGKELRNHSTYRTISLFLSTNHRSYIFIDWSDLFIVQNGVIEDDSILSFQRKVIAALSVFQVFSPRIKYSLRQVWKYPLSVVNLENILFQVQESQVMEIFSKYMAVQPWLSQINLCSIEDENKRKQ